MAKDVEGADIGASKKASPAKSGKSFKAKKSGKAPKCQGASIGIMGK